MSEPGSSSTSASALPLQDRTQHLPFLEQRRRKRELLAELQAESASRDSLGAEDLLARWPTDPSQDADAASLLFQDYCNRRSHGEDVSLAEYQQLHPEHRDSLDDLLRRQDVLRSLGAVSGSLAQPLRLPEIGEELFGFRLRRELGRGAFARVYLAEQGELASRPVVLKVSEASGDEPQTLAQLQQTNIVPIYSVHEDKAAGLRAVCMPYFGGASLSQVLQRLRENVPVPMNGHELAAALAAVDSRHQSPPPAVPSASETTSDPFTPPFVTQTFPQAAAWIVSQLAEALQHAHDRGVLHRDIKPSNVLVASDGQPLLLDFNLAQDLKEEAGRAGVGGTVAYMAPEHLRALAARDPVLARLVDRRSDIYSLGMVLFEMLAGKAPFEQSASYCPLPALIEAMALERAQARPSLKKQRADLPWALESIVCKCLASHPSERYQKASHLAEDLRAYLHDLPLRHAPELSLRERAAKWLRRHPRLSSSGSVATAAAVLLLATLGAFLGARSHLVDAREVLSSQAVLRQHDQLAQRALRLVNIGEGAAQAAPEKEEILREALDVYGVLTREDWQEQPDWRRLSAEEQGHTAEDIRELLMLLAWAHTRDPQTGPTALREALRWLDHAKRIEPLGPSRALAFDRAGYLDRLGDAAGAAIARAEAQRTPPSSSRDYYLQALAHARNGGHQEAITALDHGLKRDGQHYWSWWLRGLCHQNLEEHALAVGDFSTCLGQSAEAMVLLNRAYSYYVLGKKAEAIRDYTQALTLNPDLVTASWNRGLALLELGEYAEALEDLQTGRGKDPTLADLNIGLALEGLGRTDEADEAFALARAQLPKLQPELRRLVLCRYGIGVSKRLPRQAEAALAEALALDPEDTTALFGLGALRVEGGEPLKAMESFSRAIELRPDFVEARRFRAILAARQGRVDLAGKDINFCLAREPRGGMTLYAAACVCALSARSGEDNALIAQALALLGRAFAQGYGQDRAAHDADLDAIKHLPEFRKLVRGDGSK